PKPQRRPGAGEAIRVCRAGSRTARRRRAGAAGAPSGSFPQRHRDRGGSRVSQAAEVPGPAADAPLQLPGVAEPQRPAPFSHPIGRKKGGPVRSPASDTARTDRRIGGRHDPEETAVGTTARLDRPGGRQPSAGAAPADGRPQGHLLARNDARKGAREVLSSPRAEPGGSVGLRTSGSGRGIPARLHQERNPAPAEGTVVGAAQIHSSLNPRSSNQASTSRSLSNWGISTSSPARWRAASSSIS